MRDELDRVVAGPEQGLLDLFGGLFVDHEALVGVGFRGCLGDPAVALIFSDIVSKEGLGGWVGLGGAVGFVLVVVFQDLFDPVEAVFD